MGASLAVLRRAVPLAAAMACGSGCGDESLAPQPDPFADSRTAGLQVDSAVALFECAYSSFAWVALGPEGVVQSIAGVVANAHGYQPAPRAGACDTTSPSSTWLDALADGRSMLSNAEGTGVYDRIQDEWTLGTEGERLAAVSSIYMAAALGLAGEFFCEVTLDGGDLLTPDDVLARAEEWITGRALAHIGTHGDFALPGGRAGSAETTALALRARIRWARRDLAGAAADAERVPEGFTAWISRESGLRRRNKVYHAATESALTSMLGINDWWEPETRSSNPVTDTLWPDPIPLTGFRFLGILPDGRAVDEEGYAVRWAEEERDESAAPVPLGNGAVPDPRVPHHFASISGPELHEVPGKYASDSDDIPLVSWREMWLIRAEREGGQAAIDLVNALRSAAGVPAVTYIDGATATAEQVRLMILEERRRSLHGEGGRFWSTKIRNPDVLWFPRGEGKTPWQGYALGGAVRLALPEQEYLSNPNLLSRGGLAARGTGCDPAEAPLLP